MDVFSLEDEDYGNIFITQEPKKIVDLAVNFGEEDHDVECVELSQLQTKSGDIHFSDISEDETANDKESKINER